MPAMSFMAVLIASLLGSVHCAGMCGGIVLAYSGLAARPRLAHVSYHAGRLFSYAVLGAVAGLVGARVNLLVQPAGIRSVAALFMGALLIAWGAMVLLCPQSKVLRVAKSAALRLGSMASAPARRIFHSERKAVPVEVRALALGLATAFLPCGWLYSFVAVAVASADPWKGAGMMACFWLGSLPILASLGLFAQVATAGLKAAMPKVSAILVMLAGLAAILGHVYSFPILGHAATGGDRAGEPTSQIICAP